MENPEKIDGFRLGDPENAERGIDVIDIESGMADRGGVMERESVMATLPAVEDALHEFYKLKSIREEQAAFALQVIRDTEIIYKSAEEDLLKSGKPDSTPALAILESARGELQYRRAIIEARDDDGVERTSQWNREDLIDRDAHYQEAGDVLFSADKRHQYVTDRNGLMELLSAVKQFIKKQAAIEEEEERQKNTGLGDRPMSAFRSRFLTDVPAIERFEKGRETTRDFSDIMNMLESRLLGARSYLGDLVLQYVNDPQPYFREEMFKNLKDIRKLELFLSRLEGERNERIAKNI